MIDLAMIQDPPTPSPTVSRFRYEREKRARREAKVIASVERLHAPRADERGLHFSIIRRGPRWILGDPTRLQQIPGNFLSNAIKFTECGPVWGLVELVPPVGTGWADDRRQ